MIHHQDVVAAVGVLAVEAARLRDTCVEHKRRANAWRLVLRL